MASAPAPPPAKRTAILPARALVLRDPCTGRGSDRPRDLNRTRAIFPARCLDRPARGKLVSCLAFERDIYLSVYACFNKV